MYSAVPCTTAYGAAVSPVLVVATMLVYSFGKVAPRMVPTILSAVGNVAFAFTDRPRRTAIGVAANRSATFPDHTHAYVPEKSGNSTGHWYGPRPRGSQP